MYLHINRFRIVVDDSEERKNMVAKKNSNIFQNNNKKVLKALYFVVKNIFANSFVSEHTTTIVFLNLKKRGHFR